MGKVNPRNRPRTEADCEKAWKDGVIAGVQNASAIFLTVMLDKFQAEDKIHDIWSEINKLSDEIRERRVSIADLRTMLKEEYGIYV